MPSRKIFISHASKDDGFVKELRQALEGQGVGVWVDSRSLRGGDRLAPAIEQAIEKARQVLVVLSPQTINSPWVRSEIAHALAVQQRRRDDGYRVIPLLLPGVEPAALGLWFDEEPVGIPIALKTGGVSEALPAVLAALGERLPDDRPLPQAAPAPPVAELILELEDPDIELEEGRRRARATATLTYEPADAKAPRVESKRFAFTAPLGPIEAEDLRWYLESYYLWPVGLFKERAERIAAQLPQWGQDLFEAVLAPEAAQEAVTGWRLAEGSAGRRFTVLVNRDLPEGADKEAQAAADEAAAELLALPWELIHDGRGYLFQGRHAVRVRRRLPNRRVQAVALAELPIRILLVSPRPEEEGVGYLDHRISARPLMDAVDHLGDLVELTVLTPPTFPALEAALRGAMEAGDPFDVVHFDGHGVYDPKVGLGGLCFEDPKDARKLKDRAKEIINADKLAGVIRDYRIPLFFLEACQSAKTEKEPTASVAGRLLEEGVASVVAMSHSVLVETARRFVEPFYQALARGARVGAAMLAGQHALYLDAHRGRIMGAGDLHLHDWFVPVLYQEKHDPQLVTSVPAGDVQELQARQRRLSLGALPEPPPHAFQGRSRELLALERLLHEAPYAVVQGQGGAGKTTLAVELARWLVRTRRFRRAAFVSLEYAGDVRSVLDSLGRQLLPEGDAYSVAQYDDLKEALLPVERALRDQPTILVLDNLESVLPDASGAAPPAAVPYADLFDLCRRLLDADPATRLVFTSREALPAPFDHAGRTVSLGALSREDAVALVGQVLADEGLEPQATDPGGTPEEITELVNAVNRHARALVVLAREVARRGVRATTETLRALMAALHARYPNDREQSLYASVELSLRRLAPETRERVRALGVFHGGTHLDVLGHVLELDAEAARRLARELIAVGLAEDVGYGHLRLDPALPPYLLGEMDEAQREQAHARWAEGLAQLAHLLYEQWFKDTQHAAHLTLLELPNLLALLAWVQGRAVPEKVVDLAGKVEQLLANLGRPQALAQVIAVREAAAQALGAWGKAQFESERLRIDRLLDGGDLPSALDAARKLLARSREAGEEAYPGAAYHIATAHLFLGRVLKRDGGAEAALQPLSEAQRRFQRLADEGNADAEGMVSVAIIESGDSLRDLGRLDKAAAAYEEAIERAGKLDDKRLVSAGKFQLGTVRMLQQRYPEALAIYTEARSIFEALGEPGTVAAAWHQIGMVHIRAGQFEQAERAYRQSLAIRVQQKNRAGEAESLNELGTLYKAMGWLEEAATFYRQAADLFTELPDRRLEGVTRTNLADILVELRRYDEARREIHRAIECKRPFGHAAEPWKTWAILHDLEHAVGNPQAASEARQQAVESYLAYRHAGGENQGPARQLYAFVAGAVQQGTTAEAEQDLAQLLQADVPSPIKMLIPRLQALLRGNRDPALAADPELYYLDAAELRLLLEALG